MRDGNHSEFSCYGHFSQRPQDWSAALPRLFGLSCFRLQSHPVYVLGNPDKLRICHPHFDDNSWYRSLLGGDKALYEVVFRDGILSYIYLFALSTLNVVVVFKLPNSYLNLLASPERVLHCLLSSRVLLHIRAQMTVRQSAWSDGFTDIEFNDETNEPIGFRLHPTNSGLSPR